MSYPAHAGVLPIDVIPPTQVWLIVVYRKCVANDVRGHQVHCGSVRPISLLLFYFSILYFTPNMYKVEIAMTVITYLVLYGNDIINFALCH